MKLNQRIMMEYLQYCHGILSRETINNYYGTIKRFMIFTQGRDVTPVIASDYYKHLYECGAAPTSVSTFSTRLKSFFNWSKTNGYLKGKSPIIPPPRIPWGEPTRKPFTEDEYNRILKFVEGWPTGRHYWPTAIRIAWATGLRMGDVAMLEWKAIKWADQSLAVMPRKTRRHRKSVEVPLSPEMMQHLSEHATAQKAMSPEGVLDQYVMPGMAFLYREYGHNDIGREFTEILGLVGIEGKSFHCWRHGFITRMIEIGMNPAILCTLTGHTLAMIQRYCHPSLESKRKAMGL